MVLLCEAETGDSGRSIIVLPAKAGVHRQLVYLCQFAGPFSSWEGGDEKGGVGREGKKKEGRGWRGRGGRERRGREKIEGERGTDGGEEKGNGDRGRMGIGEEWG